MKTIGFIGLGHMGRPMATNLLRSGFNLIVYDVVESLVAPLVSAGAKSALSVGEMAKQADLIITSVQTSEQVSAICLGPQGIFSQAKSGLFYVDCSSIDMIVTQQLHRDAKKFNISMLDAPVSGGVSAAIAGSLTIMVGGEENIYQQTLPVLEKIGKKVIHAGEAGCGQAAKICNNLLLAISMVGVSEAFTLAKKLGLDQKKFFDISSNASGQCWSMTSYCPVPNILENVPSSHGYEAGFMAKMMLKDLHLSQHAAESVKAVTPLGSVATELYQLFVNQGFGDKDFSAIITLLES